MNWTSAEILRFVSWSSGVQRYMEATGRDPLAERAPVIEEVCGSPDRIRELRWLIYLKVARLEGQAAPKRRGVNRFSLGLQPLAQLRHRRLPASADPSESSRHHS